MLGARRHRRIYSKLATAAVVTCALAFATAGSVGAVPPPWAGPPFGGDDPDPAIEVCCAWDASLAHGDLTYSISDAPNQDVENAIIAGVEAWDTAIPGLSLTRDDTNPNITIAFRPSGGNVQGSARRYFDRSTGFITFVAIKISSKAFGQQNDLVTIQQIVTHEVGHGLGAGHANTGGFMMSPSLSDGNTLITQCDEDAVVAAQHWYLEDEETIPHAPHDNGVTC